MKYVDVKPDSYADFPVESNTKRFKFKVADNVRISEYKNIFSRAYKPNSTKDVFVIVKVEDAVPLMYVIENFKGKEVIGTFYEKESQKTK